MNQATTISRTRKTNWRKTVNSVRQVNAQRANWPGILFCDAQRKMFDPRPRLIKH